MLSFVNCTEAVTMHWISEIGNIAILHQGMLKFENLPLELQPDTQQARRGLMLVWYRILHIKNHGLPLQFISLTVFVLCCGGVIVKGGTLSSMVPEESEMRYSVRAPTLRELATFKARVQQCFLAAAHATGCKVSTNHCVHHNQGKLWKCICILDGDSRMLVIDEKCGRSVK